jgi:hypothetical protein
MATQLRIYTINRGQLRQFAREWGEKIRPLRERKRALRRCFRGCWARIGSWSPRWGCWLWA